MPGGFDGRRGMIYHLAVDQRLRRRGIGLRLMAELEDLLRAKGCVKYCRLVTHGNAGARTFYGELECERMDLQVYAKRLV